MVTEVPLWTPSATQIEASRLTAFATEFGLPTEYPLLHRWSIENREAFWAHIWQFCDVRGIQAGSILTERAPFTDTLWFPEATLNFADNLLKYHDSQTALVEVNEAGVVESVSYAELHSKVAQVAHRLRELGIGVGDRVAAWLPNQIDTVVGMLATTSIGAVWSSCSPDFGVPGALDRFGQIEPKVLFAIDEYSYNGRVFELASNVQRIREQIPSIEQVFWVSKDPSKSDFTRMYEADTPSLEFEALPFNHPLYIMFSSGTTGRPKCIVHGAGGTLLQHLKEHQLHANLTRDSTLFFFTTTGWMMWNWLVTGLATGCKVVLYDGSPFYPQKDTLITLIDEHQITHFGVGAKYISSIERVRVKPRESHDLSTLQCVLSTGSPLSPESFDYVYRDFKRDVWLASISGGTDLISCFVLGNPWGAVYKGEIQGPGLGMATGTFNSSGQPIEDEKGELVCTASFPSTPIAFWNDPDGSRYHGAYFERFEHTWAHGDFAEVNSATNGYVIHGRSDAVLNPGGVRIGTAEIYRQLEHFEVIADAVCVGQEWEDDTRVILFVVLEDRQQLDKHLRRAIKKEIRTNASPRHVPAKIVQVKDVPRTRSGKIAELAVRDTIHGRTVKHTTALENPDSLKFFAGIEALKR